MAKIVRLFKALILSFIKKNLFPSDQIDVLSTLLLWQQGNLYDLQKQNFFYQNLKFRITLNCASLFS